MTAGLRAHPADSRDREWTFSCEADALLASSARMAACTSPVHPGAAALPACEREASEHLERALQSCRDGDVVVQLIDLSKVHIKPMPLLPDVKPKDDVVAAELIEKEVEKKLEEAQKQAKARPRPTGQVVEITRPTVEMAPDKARYVSEYDSKVEKQTVARGTTDKMVERPAPAHKTAKAPPPDQAASATAAERSPSPIKGPGQGPGKGPSMMSMRGPESMKDAPPALHDPGIKSGQKLATSDGIGPRQGQGGPYARMTETRPSPTPPGGTEAPGGGGGPERKPLDLQPSKDLLERTAGGGSVDDIDDADQGEFTALNSRRWKYATFFNRMKRQVAQNWHPDEVYLQRDPNGNVYGTRDRLTILKVSLKPDGQVAKIYVIKQSGVDFLDDEAVRAFRQAQPFPNPPSGLVDLHSNLITFRFGFHFEIGGDHSRWKIFRYQ